MHSMIPMRATGGTDAGANRAPLPPRATRYRVVVVDEQGRLDDRLRRILVHDLGERLASWPASVDAAADRGR